MTKEELENATGKELIEQRNYCGIDGYYSYYLDDVNAEMLKRFNRLTELTDDKNKLLDVISNYEVKVADLEQKNADLKEEIDEIVFARGELEQENESLENIKNIYIGDLLKAKELLLELYDCIPASMVDSCKETLQKVALFFKESEVSE